MKPPQIGDPYLNEILTQPWMYVDKDGVKCVRKSVVYFVKSVVRFPTIGLVGARLWDMVRQQVVDAVSGSTQSRGVIHK